MQKQFEIMPRHGAWDVRHNQVSFRVCEHKRDAIRLALRLGRLQGRLGDDAEVILLNGEGAPLARRRIPAKKPN